MFVVIIVNSKIKLFPTLIFFLNQYETITIKSDICSCAEKDDPKQGKVNSFFKGEIKSSQKWLLDSRGLTIMKIECQTSIL